MQTLGLRGATTADSNTASAILDATEELLIELVAVNDLVEADIGALFFSVTNDLNAEFPAKAARLRLGWETTALMDCTKIPVPGAPESVIRVLMLINTTKQKEDLHYVYLKGASKLRTPSN